MTKRFQVILAISATVLFVIAFLLDISFFGQGWATTWRNIDIIKFFIILSFIIVGGLLLGLLLFRKQKYSQRIFWTLPIAFILFSVANISNSAIDYYGFYQEYNYFTAKQDIKKGKIQILETGLVLPEPSIDWEKEKAAQKITEQHFGYKSINLGCNEANGIAIYNNVMENHLEKMNGKDWRIKEQKLRDSILKSINPK